MDSRSTFLRWRVNRWGDGIRMVSGRVEMSVTRIEMEGWQIHPHNSRYGTELHLR